MPLQAFLSPISATRGRELPSEHTQINGDKGFGDALSRGAADIAAGAGAWRNWCYLSWHEVKRQYKRSVLGPMWLTLNMGVLVGALGWFYSSIFNQDIQFFLPYLALGFIIFGLISGMVNESCTIFSNSSAGIKQSAIPLSFYCFKAVTRQAILFAHNILIYFVILIFFDVPVGLSALLIFPALILIFIGGFFVMTIIGPISARFRDIPPIVTSIMQIFFFFTPIFWLPTDELRRSELLFLNPFYHYLEMTRRPLLGLESDPVNWIVALGITVVLGIVSLTFFSKYRSQIVYWV